VVLDWRPARRMLGWPPRMPPKVTTILLNWNRYELSRACIESLARVTYPNHSIVLVDNASADGSGPRLHRDFPEIEYVQNHDNAGFSRGCNEGIKRALELGTDYVLLLNNDSIVEPNFLEPLVSLLEGDDSIGMASGKIYLSDRRTLWFAGARVSRVAGSVVVRGHKQPDQGLFDHTEESKGCTGAMMFIRKRVIDLVGPLPPEYFFGTEEWDYSLTVRRAGFKLYYCPASVVFHQADGSHDNLAPMYLYCGMRNRLTFQSKFLPRQLFHLWSLTYSFYVHHIAGLRLKLTSSQLHAFRAAHEQAVRDHEQRGSYVTEEDLLRFDREYAAALRARP